MMNDIPCMSVEDEIDQHIKYAMYDLSEWVANKFISMGMVPFFSTGVCGDTTAGFGNLDSYGYWEFPLANPELYLKRGQ